MRGTWAFNVYNICQRRVVTNNALLSAEDNEDNELQLYVQTYLDDISK